MIERTHRYGNLVFERDAIVRAALRAYIECIVHHSRDRRLPLSFPACDYASWMGDLRRGAFYNGDLEGNNDVIAWTEAGVVGLAYELGFGPIEQLGLPVDAVTGGPDDVRAALPKLPAELEPALMMAASMLDTGQAQPNWVVYGERLAGVGFWLYGDQVAGTLFDKPTSCGAHRLAAWGMLRGGRLWPLLSYFSGPRETAIVVEQARKEATTHALLDEVTNRALKGPTELTPAELEALLCPLAMLPPKGVFEAQRMLAKVGVTWPGSPEIPEEPEPRS